MATQPGPGDHIIRHVVPIRLSRRRIRTAPTPNVAAEWMFEFEMLDGHTLYVGLKSGGDPVRMLTMLEKALGGKKAPVEELWDPDRDMPR